MHESFSYDILIIGSGGAGLALALQLAPFARIALLCKSSLMEGATLYAQGGVAAVLDLQDTIESHIEDTLIAGAGLSDPNTVRFVTERARSSIQFLVQEGVAFTQEMTADGQPQYHLAREGGHSHRRILHAADATGRAVETTLADQARQHPHIDIFEYCMAIDLITHQQRCTGAYVLQCEKQRVVNFHARFVVLATGGASKVYLYTTNPDVSSGDGIAMAWRAGCRVANMEFNQFHPTCLYHPKAKSFLITEAIRGEGGKLLLPDGTRFMPAFDARAELAPRDIVARAIDHEMKRLGIPCVYLDISHQSKDFILEHFPTIYARCLEYGIDITCSPIPVVPAAHYTCGGIMTDLHGRTDLAGLYAIGETAFTGLHGANRMASNSLLECIVFAAAAADDIKPLLANTSAAATALPWDESQVTHSDEEIVVSHNWDELRRLMWDYVGIVRTTKRLMRAKRRIDLLQEEIQSYYAGFRVTRDLLELRNLVVVADLIVRSALMRHESRGLHYTLDFPSCHVVAKNTILRPIDKSRQKA